jgi:Rad3-related DNA helicase
MARERYSCNLTDRTDNNQTCQLLQRLMSRKGKTILLVIPSYTVATEYENRVSKGGSTLFLRVTNTASDIFVRR